MRQYLKFWAFVISVVGTIFSCRPPAVTVQFKPENIRPVVIEAPLLIPKDSNDPVFVGLKNFQTVFQFYKSNHSEVGWTNDTSAFLRDSIVTFIRTIRYHGLLPQDYHGAEINRLVNALDRNLIYRRDVLLTDAFLSIASDLKFGRFNSLNEPLENDSLNLRLLHEVLYYRTIQRIVKSHEPRHSQYHELQEALKMMIDSADSIDHFALLAGLTYDSSILHKQIQRLEVNLERWRMEVPSLGSRYIVVNIPAYELQVIENGTVALESRVIVGKPQTPSPTLSSEIECITLYPYWHVPRKIAVEEFLPHIKKDTSFLSLNNFQVLDRKGMIVRPDTLNWKTYNKNNFPFTLRQREGKENSLGLIKFVFDNPYAVYLHDTNAKGLFKNKKRAYSHGCIRMEKAKELATYLIPTPGRIDKILKARLRKTINLVNPIPIHIRYFTCESVNGTLRFYEDIYEKDKAIINYLYAPSSITRIR